MAACNQQAKATFFTNVCRMDINLSLLLQFNSFHIISYFIKTVAIRRNATYYTAKKALKNTEICQIQVGRTSEQGEVLEGKLACWCIAEI